MTFFAQALDAKWGVVPCLKACFPVGSLEKHVGILRQLTCLNASGEVESAVNGRMEVLAITAKLFVVGFTMLFSHGLLAESCNQEPSDDAQSCLEKISEYSDKLDTYRGDVATRNETALLEVAEYFRDQKDDNISCVVSLSNWIPSEVLAVYLNETSFISFNIERYVRLKSAGVDRQTEDQMYVYVEDTFSDLKQSIDEVITHELAFIPCDERDLHH